MFQFPRFPSGVSTRCHSITCSRLLHSGTRGSPGARPSPRLFATHYALLRPSVPRHPPPALLHYPCPSPPGSLPRARTRSTLLRSLHHRPQQQHSKRPALPTAATAPLSALPPLIGIPSSLSHTHSALVKVPTHPPHEGKTSIAWSPSTCRGFLMVRWSISHPTSHIISTGER